MIRKEKIKVNRITSPRMPGMNDMVLTYYQVYDIIFKIERRKL